VTVGQDLFKMEPGDAPAEGSSSGGESKSESKEESSSSSGSKDNAKEEAPKKSDATSSETKAQEQKDSGRQSESSQKASQEGGNQAHKRNEASSSSSGSSAPKKDSKPSSSGSSGDKKGASSGSVDSAPATKGSRDERRVKMNRMRLRIAERLKQSQNTAASLTTFNEIDMSNLMAFRARHKDRILKEQGVKLGFMGAFARASALALKEIPAANASIEGEGLGDTIVYRDYVDLSVAVSTEKGLVTPVVRSVEQLSILDIEREITALGKKVSWREACWSRSQYASPVFAHGRGSWFGGSTHVAHSTDDGASFSLRCPPPPLPSLSLSLQARDNKLTLEDMAGGTFTISNGGVFGSLFGTPILNLPGSAILGMHAINNKPWVVDGKVDIRPIMVVGA
jgi:pyruvate/2-oxoglutarate dehydrogenase complex dihydrolipoamide acyltransferase (E2) component